MAPPFLPMLSGYINIPLKRLGPIRNERYQISKTMSIDKIDHDEWIFIELVDEELQHIVLFAALFCSKTAFLSPLAIDLLQSL